MITPMKKYRFLVFHGVYDAFLQSLQEAGVLHVVEKNQGVMEDPGLLSYLDQGKRLNALIKGMKSRLAPDACLLPAAEDADGIAVMARLEALLAEKADLGLKTQSLRKEYETNAIWGDFDPAALEALSPKCRIQFYTCQKSSYKPEWESLYYAIPVAEQNGKIFFVICLPNGEEMPEIEADGVRWPKRSLTALQSDIDALQARIQAIEDQLDAEAPQVYQTLVETEKEVHDALQFSNVKLCQTEKTAADKVMFLEGFVPEDKEAALQATLQEEGIYYEVSRPTVEDKVPIQLRNNRYARLYEPITRMYSLPNYTEIDPTPFLAPFFMLFFGLCLGDGGYGALILIASLLLRNKLGEGMKPLVNLAATLGATTLLVGLLTGSFFGVSLDAVTWPWLQGVKGYFLTQANYGHLVGGYNPMMVLALIIGVIQILYAMGISVAKTTRQFGFRYAMSTLAWLVLLVMCIVTFGLPMLTGAFPLMLKYACYAILGVCAVVIYFFNSPGKNIFLNVGSGLWTTYNMASGLLGDILSYVRLFALGLTGSILGQVFNSMAFGMTGGMPGWARWFAVLLILLVGHSLNFALSIIGAVVHPLRLTFVEFYKNEGFEGGGKPYSPFARSRKK